VRFFARSGDVYDDGYCTVVGFAEQPDGSGQSLILSIQNEPEQQDFDTAAAGVYAETSEGMDGYDLVADVQFDAPELVVSWTDNPQDAARVDISAVAVDQSALAEALQMMRQRLNG
jgi:hypothetical protein